MRKGISLVALIITIIVLIILTAAVIMTGGDSPAQAKQAVFFNDVTTVQEAVTLARLNNYVAANTGDTTVTEWTGILASGAVEVNGISTCQGFASGAEVALNLSMTNAQLNKFAVDPATGIVYLRTGVIIDSKDASGSAITQTYYNKTAIVGSAVAGAVSIANYSL